MIGETIKKLRGWMPQAELARQVGVSRATVNGWELGRYGPSRDVLPKLAAVLGTTIDALLSPEGATASCPCVPVEGTVQTPAAEIGGAS